jgi:UDP-N-acetylglucosamine acyltransferase
MAYAHIGHDSVIGDGCILANAATLAGHVTVEDYASVGALCPVHQFCRIGRYAYIGGGTTITQDVLPYSLTSAKRETHAYGINKVGLERRGFSTERLRAIQRAFRLLLAGKLNTTQALERLKSETLEKDTALGEAAQDDLRYLIDFIESSHRGVLK